MNKLNIVWIDRDPEEITKFVEESKITDVANVTIFTKFHYAKEFLQLNSSNTDLIISNYQTSQWRDIFHPEKNPDDGKLVFDFYDDLKENSINKPMILFSSLAEINKKTYLYNKYDDFTFINKIEAQKLFTEINRSLPIQKRLESKLQNCYEINLM